MFKAKFVCEAPTLVHRVNVVESLTEFNTEATLLHNKNSGQSIF